MNILCKLGIHRWWYFCMDWTFVKAFPNKAIANRRCTRCKRMECTDDGRVWHHRL